MGRVGARVVRTLYVGGVVVAPHTCHMDMSKGGGEDTATTGCVLAAVEQLSRPMPVVTFFGSHIKSVCEEVVLGPQTSNFDTVSFGTDQNAHTNTLVTLSHVFDYILTPPVPGGPNAQ